MLDAEVFLSFGISGINDLVEYERMRNKKKFCEYQAEIRSIKELNWCAYHLDSFPHDKNKILFY